MYLLVTTGHPDMARYAHPHLGRLVQPRHYSSVAQTAREGIVWAADNDCFQGLKEDAYLAMLAAIGGLPGCEFVTVPDVVGDHAATIQLWHKWAAIAGQAQPPAFVLQDGVAVNTVPWSECGAVFVGGTTTFKLGPEAAACVREAKRRGLWAHMGRVNSLKRMRYAASIGCDSVDGSMFARFKATHLPNGLRWAEAASKEFPMAPRRTTAAAPVAAEHASLNAAKLAIQSGMPAFQKDKVNPHFGSSYLALETLLPQVIEVVTANGCTLTQWPTIIHTATVPVGGLRTRITHATTGEFEEDTMLLSAGRDTPQAQGSAITYARRYAAQSILGITADKDDDANAAQPSSRGSRTAAPALAGSPQVDAPDPFGGAL